MINFNKTSITFLIVLFSLVLLSALFHFYFTQNTMVSEIRGLQQDINQQKRALTSAVNMLEEERQEKKVLLQTNESLQQSLQITKQRKDSIWLELQGTKKALNKARKRLYEPSIKHPNNENKHTPFKPTYERVPASGRQPADSTGAGKPFQKP